MVADVIVHADRTTVVNVVLAEVPVEIGEIVVQAIRPDVERDKTSTGQIVRFDEVQAIPGIRNIGDVLVLAADVIDGHFRGGRQGEEYYILQGMGIVNPLDNSSAFMPIMSAVEEVEVITSGFSAQYGNAQSGVVRISMKEGNRTQWATRFESRLRVPRRKHFGPSVFDPKANDYMRLFYNNEGNIWLTGDPESDTPQPFYGAMASGLTSYFAGDTLAQLAMARALYEQMRRDVNRRYGNHIDYNVELATGGPLSERARLFMALGMTKQWPFLPTEDPDLEYQTMGNVVVDVVQKATFRLSGGVAHQRNNVFPGRNSVSGYQRWLWDRIVGIQDQQWTNVQLGGRWTHALSLSTYYELQLSTLHTYSEVGSAPTPPTLPDTVDINWAVGTQ